MIAIVNYGSGNIGAISNIYKKAKVEHVIVERPELLDQADRYILPGVGHFDHAVSYLRRSGLLGALQDNVIKQQKPLLGICVGMQILADSSEEGSEPGLGWVPGRVRKFERSNDCLRIPHMGWNEVEVVNDGACLLDRVDSSIGFYFLHSYYFDPMNSRSILAQTVYGRLAFASAVTNGSNIFGVQFHPEKSHHNGMAVLTNFATLKPCSALV